MPRADKLADDATHILVVDDDRRIRELLASYLSANGFRVSTAGDVRQTRERMRGLSFDLVILDIMMPGESGLDLARQLRAANDGVPILFLSALAEIDDRIEGLTAGGDDYLAKPFEPRELLLRVRNVLRRAAPTSPPVEEVRFGPNLFQLARGELRRDGELVRLTTRERDMLRILSAKAGQTVARDELAQSGSDEGARSVDVQINRLRRKIEMEPSAPVFLQTVRGQGYTLIVD